MSLRHYPKIVTNGLVLCLDAANPSSYPGTGSVWNDLSGNENNGTLVNGVGYNTSNKGSLIFDGSNDYVNSTSISSQFTADMTVEAWIYLSSYPEDWVRIIGTGGNSGNRTFGLWYNGPSSGRILWQRHGAGDPSIFPVSPTLSIGTWHHIVATTSGSSHVLYLNASSIGTATASGPWAASGENITIGFAGHHTYHNGRVSTAKIYNRALTPQEVQDNYNALSYRTTPNGTLESPFTSPVQAQSLGYADGNYYFLSGTMASVRLLEFKNNFYENKSWVCVFRSPYNSTATTNQLDFNIPMRGLLVQRDALDLRAAVYWSNPITYNSIGVTGNNTADSGYSPRRVILGYSGGHGIYAANQSQCNWGNGIGAIGAGWNGSTCGTFPNNLLWGTGQSGTATYTNMSGIWSHWTYWE